MLDEKVFEHERSVDAHDTKSPRSNMLLIQQKSMKEAKRMLLFSRGKQRPTLNNQDLV